MTRRVGLSVLVCLLGLTGLATTAPADASGGATASGRSSRTATTSSPDVFARRLFDRINVRRDRRGCHEFRPNAALALAAQRHSNAMSAQRILSHRLVGEADLGVRITRAGYTHWRMVAENLAWGQASPRAVFRAWVHSPGHRANLDNCYLRDLGVGVVIVNGRPWVTADFGHRHR